MTPKEKEDTDIKEYAQQVLDSKRWVNTSIDLLDSIKSLEPIVRNRWDNFNNMKGDVRSLMIHKTFFFLLGLSIENLLKSRIVKYNQSSLRKEIFKNGKLPAILKGNHDLLKLAWDAKINITSEQSVLLKRLSRAILWSGRYAFPQSYKAWSFDDYSPDDIDNMKNLFNHIYQLVTQSNK
ncbi:MAG: hypothetical protein F9K22_11990 [Bacteroidetes bacterium]|nr:MAG: hypothetical protein F9K22_11990 [Bacteroidota bacterium]